MRKIHLIFVAIFVAIAIPVIVLLAHSYSQLQQNAQYAYREHAFLVLQMLNQRFVDDMTIEDQRSYSEYRFIRAVPVIGGEEITLSELANFPLRSHFKGIVGHFQMDPDGTLRTPILPDGVLEKIPMADRNKREAVLYKLQTILMKQNFRIGEINNIKPQPRDSIESILDQIYKQDLGLSASKNQKKPYTPKREKRFEQTSEKESFAFNVESTRMDAYGLLRTNIDTTHVMEVEIEPFQATFDNTYIIFYRNVKRGSEIFVQGFIVELRTYLTNLVMNEIKFSPQEQNLVIEFVGQDKPLVSYGDLNKSSTLLLSTPLPSPLGSISLNMYVTQKQSAPGSGILLFLGIAMLVVLGGGLICIYKLTQSQLALASKRQDFVSAVSHELKTPLTAIRMYAELLQNSWVANEDKRQKYYNQIASETERLTRLIQNVLNLSKLDGNRWNVQLRKERPKGVLDDFVATYSKNVEKQGFELTVSSDTDVKDITLMMDRDAIMQILMNLVDNSLKFSKNADYKMINIELRLKDTDLYLAVRDYGPGIPQAEMTKVFQEFYRVENEMTRQTSGTGIGLSMVKKLCTLTNMKIELENANPGLRTKIHFPPLSI
ncbi:MAG: HAMP domain-containing histidine kinase [Fibrobacter sp.]|nr:HAMP domain-containing histidine kinase [Fibrobacter sp.]